MFIVYCLHLLNQLNSLADKSSGLHDEAAGAGVAAGSPPESVEVILLLSRLRVILGLGMLTTNFVLKTI